MMFQVATGTTVQTTTEKQNGDRLNGQTLIGIIEAPGHDLTYPVVEGAQKAQIDFCNRPHERFCRFWRKR